MKLGTDIKPRRDGIVIARVGDAKYEFKPDEGGLLVCDVPDEDVAALIQTENFYPFDPADYDRAVASIGPADLSDGDEGGDGDNDLDDGDMLPPVETPTPRKKPGRKPGKK